MKFSLTILSLLITATSVACPIPQAEMEQHYKKIAFNNTLPDEDHEAVEGSATEKEFKDMIHKAKMFYSPVFDRMGFRLRIEAAWNDPTTNAFASQEKNVKSVATYGGYARVMSHDSFLSVLCHEIGHHIGGFPLYPYEKGMSSEGQSDYFSTLRCMKDLLRGDPKNKLIAEALDLPTEIKAACKRQYGVGESYYICLRGAKAAEDYGRQRVRRSGGNEMTISLLTPSAEVVTETIASHPESQCRTDTKLQGILCNLPTTLGLSKDNELVGTCNSSLGHTVGTRPSCWFAATKR